MIKKIVWSVIILGFLAVFGVGGSLYYMVVLHPGDAIKPENIRSILGKESPVLYSDGQTRLGVFFSEAHRQYVQYDEIPVNFINALVASEDNRFFSHFGFDIFGIARAMLKNIQSGRIVQGGSTLTQQTAKNLFKREERSVRAKLKELLFALRLEHYYNKENIFEFYANQFYVSGNGHGLGVAARYYFDKKPEELSLLQCAFIAGSVKRPNAYNPFIKRTEEQRQKALKLGRSRVNYVLGKMLELDMISEYQYGLAKFSDINFLNGRVGYSLDYVMEMVKDAVTSEEVTAALQEHNIENIATSGVRIITTVEKNIQDQTLYSLRHDLSRLDVRLRGYERETVQQELSELNYGGDTTLKAQAFLFGTILDIPEDKEGGYEIRIDLGRKFGEGIIDKQGLTRLVKARSRFETNPWNEPKEKDYVNFLKQLQKDDKVWVSVRGRLENGDVLLELEKFPELNGGALVIKDGEIRAVAGGVENRFYNRAIYAKRTMGSSFKPFVFAAAMQLGWNSADPLMNSRDLFIFQNQPYFPRPDHTSPHGQVSMSWAGVKSENVASVWLLSHLCDKLTKEQFREVAAYVDMAPRMIDDEEESYVQFRSRIRDNFGIVIDRSVLRETAFQYARNNIETDLIFAGRAQEFASLNAMEYGLYFDDYELEIQEELDDEEEEPTDQRKAELEFRQEILAYNFLDFEVLRRQLEDYRKSLWELDDFLFAPVERNTEPADPEEEVEVEPMLLYDELTKRYYFMREPDLSSGMREVPPYNLMNYLERLEESERRRFWRNVVLDGRVSVESFDLLVDQVARELQKLEKIPPYKMDILEQIQDYRILVGMNYLIAFGRELGVESELEPVLSFPLGSNVVTLFEALRIYEALATGEVSSTGKHLDDSNDLLSVIDRIESADGKVLYKPERQSKRLLAPKTSLAVGHILEKVVTHGTGRYADRNIKLTDEAGALQGGFTELNISIPVLGKTGTANRYTNASFLGFLPTLSDKRDSLSMADGYAVGVYVGYDDNKPMKHGKTRIAGSGGALPIWSEIVEAIVRQEKFASDLDPVDLSFSGLKLDRQSLEQLNLSASPSLGGMVASPAKALSQFDRYTPSIMTFGEVATSGEFILERDFAPFWQVAPIVETTLTQ